MRSAEAEALLRARYRPEDITEARLKMAEVPDVPGGAALIENPVSAAPGFVVENVNVMAGVPTVFQAMVASVLPGLIGGQPLISETLRIDRGEGDIAGPLGALAEEYPHLSMGSYPFQKDGVFGAHVVIRGSDPGMVEAAMVKLKAAFA